METYLTPSSNMAAVLTPLQYYVALHSTPPAVDWKQPVRLIFITQDRTPALLQTFVPNKRFALQQVRRAFTSFALSVWDRIAKKYPLHPQSMLRAAKWFERDQQDLIQQYNENPSRHVRIEILLLRPQGMAFDEPLPTDALYATTSMATVPSQGAQALRYRKLRNVIRNGSLLRDLINSVTYLTGLKYQRCLVEPPHELHDETGCYVRLGEAVTITHLRRIIRRLRSCHKNPAGMITCT